VYKNRNCLVIAGMILILMATACKSSRSAGDGFRMVFDGKTLTDWDYDPVYWRVENGELVGEITPATLLKRNSFITRKNLVTKDFELKVEYLISGEGNSGINYRSELIDSLPFSMKGYQSDIDGRNRYTGQNYEERGRTILAYRGQKVVVNSFDHKNSTLKDHVKSNAWTLSEVTGSLGEADSLRSVIKNNDWNECHLVVRGNRMQHYVNGVLMSDVTDNDTVYRKFSGSLGVQVHVGPPMKIRYRNFRIKDL
jgi:hypothetical protein